MGGTVGDIESSPFIHAMSELQRRAGSCNFLQIQVSYVPVIGAEQSSYRLFILIPSISNELIRLRAETKPTQRAISDIRKAGLKPDLVKIFILSSLPSSDLHLTLDRLPL